MLAALLALGASASWGVGDFLGGVKSRTLHPLAILAVSQPVGLALLGLAVAIRASGPPGADVAWAVPAAVVGTVGLAAFYRGMASGAISIVAPIAGAGAAIPVVAGVISGYWPSALQGLGFAAAIGGVVLASWDRAPGRSRWAAGAGFGIVSMVAFGSTSSSCTGRAAGLPLARVPLPRRLDLARMDRPDHRAAEHPRRRRRARLCSR